MNRPDPDIDTKVRNTVRCLNETIQSNANEPSLALYRIQEHIQKNLPVMVQKRYELIGFQERLNGFVFDIEYGVDAVRDMGTSTEHIHNIIVSLEKALQIGKQINVLRQQQVQQLLFEKKDGPILGSLKN